MDQPISQIEKKKPTVLPLLIVVQLAITICTLGYVAFDRLNQKPVEYPVVIVQPPSENSYRDKFEGKITVFDLPDFSEWRYFNNPQSSDSARGVISFIYPPNFDVEQMSDGSIRLLQNRKEFIVMSPLSARVDASTLPHAYKELSFDSRRKFYQYEDIEAVGLDDSFEPPIIYQGTIGSYGLSVVDMRLFSPEVVYLILLSMDYVE